MGPSYNCLSNKSQKQRLMFSSLEIKVCPIRVILTAEGLSHSNVL